MPRVEKAFNKVRCELAEIGLLGEGIYLDNIDLVVSAIPSRGETGYVFDEGTPFFHRIIFFKSGVIYLPSDIPQDPELPRSTMLNTIRHEFAHAWYWLDPDFFSEPWFAQTFMLEYRERKVKLIDLFWERKERSRKFQRELETLTPARLCRFMEQAPKSDFVSEYAGTLAKEDFAETFMFYLRHRKTLEQFAGRPGLYKKLKAIERAVSKIRKRNRL